MRRRSFSPPDDRSRTMNEKTPDVSVAAFAYAAKPLLTAARRSPVRSLIGTHGLRRWPRLPLPLYRGVPGLSLDRQRLFEWVSARFHLAACAK